MNCRSRQTLAQNGGLGCQHLDGTWEIVCVTSSVVVIKDVFIPSVGIDSRVDTSIDICKEYISFNCIVHTKCQHQCKNRQMLSVVSLS